jgi:hypothetical protein
MKLMPFKVLLLGIAILPSISKAQTDVKTWEEYAYKNAEANDVKAKKTVKPVDIPEYNSLLSVNQSGDAVINIPVVNVSGRKLSLPININYTTSGIKVNQKAGDIGLGWNISFGSIVRDYGAFEPDYTYLGSEFEMKHYNNHGPANPSGANSDWKFQPNNSGYPPINPLDHNRVLPYTGVESGRAPDEYNINIPGLGGNSFWSYNTTSSSTDPNFVFSEKMPWKVDFSKTTFTFPQEVSRINEFDFQLSTGSQTELDYSRNFASAIAFYPYVKNASFTKCVSGPFPSPSLVSNPFSTSSISYEDYSSFTVTTGDGTRYVFGKPLRAQKYLIDEEPFWCTMNANPYYSSNPPTVTQTKSYGEFWKTEYVAEWLLTAVLSNDYVDVNSNGPDNSDYGDWIKINYSSNYKEWLNFTQTDKESSLYRERAYVTEINTPTEQFIVNTVQKKDIDDDHFKEPFNRILGDYKYVNATVSTASTTNIAISSKHPIETRCYSSIEKLHKFNPINSGSHLTYQLNYAAPGSSQELCPSHYYIMDNASTPNYVSYNPADLGGGLDASTFYHSQTKGKKTLTGLTFGNTSSSATYGYSFVYGNNKSYDDIGLFKLRKMAAFPSIRESHRSSTQRWSNTRTLNGGTPIASSIMPWFWTLVNHTQNFIWGVNTSTAVNTNGEYYYSHPIIEDEMGYYPNTPTTFQRDAWSLSEIKLPYGGNVKFTFENDDFDIVNDRNEWKKNDGMIDYCIPSVGHYNNVAHIRTIKQTHAIGNTSPKHLYREFYFTMNQNSGGMRLNKIEYNDIYNNTTVTKSFQYGLGHYTNPPAEYYQNYFSALGTFLYSEITRHQNNEVYDPIYQSSIPYSFNEYNATMARLLASGNRIDNNLRKFTNHYYEYIDDIASDGSKTRSYYGLLIPLQDINYSSTRKRLAYNKVFNAAIKGEYSDRLNFLELFTTDVDKQSSVGNYKTELFDKYNNLVKEVNTEYEYTQSNTNVISTKEQVLFDAEYRVWALFNIPNSWSLCEQTGAFGFSPGTPYVTSMYGSGILGHLNYTVYSANHQQTNYNGGGGLMINSISESVTPILIAGFKSGFLSTPPAWLNSVINTTNPWTASNSQVASDMQTHVVNHSTSYIMGFRNGPTEVFNAFRDYSYFIKSRVFTTNESYQLRPKSSTVTMKY